MNKTLVIIPALNEAGSIGKVVRNVLRHVPEAGVVVINDGSTDDTARLAREAGAEVLDMPFNVGIGAAMQAGYYYADRMGYQTAVQIDGDGQHPVGHLRRMLESLHNGTDMVIGSRFVEQSRFRSKFSRKVGIVLLSKFISAILRERITDTTSGYRAVNRRVIRLFSRCYPHDYPEPEVLVLLHKAGFKVKEIPVPIKHRRTGVSSINLLKGLYYILKVCLAIFVDLFKEVPKLPSDDVATSGL